MLNAIQQGILTPSTKQRLDELEQTKQEIEVAICQEQIKNPSITKEEIICYIKKFRDLNLDDINARKALIDNFINCIYLYDDKLLFTFNFKEGTKELSLNDLESDYLEHSSDMRVEGSPENEAPRKRCFFRSLVTHPSSTPPKTHRVLDKGSHTPPEGRQACLSGAGCGYIRRRRNSRVFILVFLFILAFSRFLCYTELSNRKERGMGALKTLWSLFLSMFKIGLFTFGGGYAMIGILEREFVEKKNWLSHDEFMDLIVIAESTPGPIAINCATYIGYKVGKGSGAVAATLGMVMPSFSIIYLISLFFNQFLSITWVSSAFRGIQACVVFLILSAGSKMLKKMKKTAFSITTAAVTFVCMVTFWLLGVHFSSIFYILISACLGLAVWGIGRAAAQKKRADGEVEK